MVKKLYKIKVVHLNQSKLITSGPYSLVRHPVYLAWILIFTGFSFILDSPLGVLFIPFLVIILEFHSIFEEKYVLIPNFKDKYYKYKKKVPYRLFFPPYNYVIIFLALILIYIGFLNFILKI